MKLNWKLLIFDLLVIAWIAIAMLAWQDRDEYGKFRDIVMGVMLLVWRIDAHYSFYKKEKRFY